MSQFLFCCYGRGGSLLDNISIFIKFTNINIKIHMKITLLNQEIFLENWAKHLKRAKQALILPCKEEIVWKSLLLQLYFWLHLGNQGQKPIFLAV